MVIPPPFLKGLSLRVYAAAFSFVARVFPPMAILVRSSKVCFFNSRHTRDMITNPRRLVPIGSNLSLYSSAHLCPVGRATFDKSPRNSMSYGGFCQTRGHKLDIISPLPRRYQSPLFCLLLSDFSALHGAISGRGRPWLHIRSHRSPPVCA